MSFRTKLFWVFLLTVLVTVSVVGYSVTYYSRAAFEEIDRERTEALVSQFQKEYVQRGEEIGRQLDNIINSELTLRTAIELAKPNADQSIFFRDATGIAQDHGLDFVELVDYQGTLISSAQYPARVGYKEDWVTQVADWHEVAPFLRREEMPDGSDLSLTAVRAISVEKKNLYIVGGKRMDRKLLASLVLPAGMRALLYRNLDQNFSPAQLIDATDTLQNPERFETLINQVRKQTQPVVKTVDWTGDAVDAETFHSIPLLGRNGETLGTLLVGSSRRELVLLTRKIVWIAAGVGVAALLIALILTSWISRRITRPLEDLAEGARDVASGRWDRHIDLRGRDEVGQLAGAFNEMTHTLAAQKERLVQAERVAAWRELARRLAHELRNPLFPLQITVENLQRARQLGPDQFQEVFNESTATLKAELANLNAIVGRFSDFSKMPAPQFTRVRVNEALRDAMRLFEPQFNAVGKPPVTTELILADGLPDVDADPDLLHKAFQNLILNALDAMPAGGALTLRTSERDGKVRIEVTDTGKGLTPEECSRLFTPYYTTKQLGTGLGLAIVQSIVSDHQGTISVSSEEGRGTTFRIELPQKQTNTLARLQTEETKANGEAAVKTAPVASEG
ncbi:MAG: HAMP domain-containing protein [Acidobacteria bacterium]|nr:HAMP domain-containing protein [Acidobacteriota bacterium]MBS1867097.1 HAMP domain-containing protein [Acidobacteriota bacterium]